MYICLWFHTWVMCLVKPVQLSLRLSLRATPQARSPWWQHQDRIDYNTYVYICIYTYILCIYIYIYIHIYIYICIT